MRVRHRGARRVEIHAPVESHTRGADPAGAASCAGLASRPRGRSGQRRGVPPPQATGGKAASMAGISLANGHTPGVTTLLASAQCPTFAARAQGRPPSSFHRYSLRTSMFRFHTREAYGRYFRINHTDMSMIAYKSPLKLFWFRHPIVWANSRENEALTLWQLQFDFVDLFSRAPDPPRRPGKRRRRTMDQFLRVSGSGGEDEVDPISRARKFNGVRFRDERNRWVAEMKPPKYKNKVSFGDFKCPTEAARAVDAAFYYYGKTEQLNFADTPNILSTIPLPLGLSEVDKLSLVKEQARWLASMASTLPASPCSSTRDVVASVSLESSRGLPLEEADDGVSSNSVLIADDWTAWICPDDGVSSSSVRIAEDWTQWICPDSAAGARTNFVSFPGVEEVCMNLLLTSPGPALSVWQAESSRVDVADGMVELQSFACEV